MHEGQPDVDDLVQDCGNSSALVLELPQSCSKFSFVSLKFNQCLIVTVTLLGYVTQVSKFQIECTCPSGKWIVKITCPNVPFTCLKYIKPMQLMWKSEIRSRPSDKSCWYFTCPTVIFTRLRWSDEWNFKPCDCYHDAVKLSQLDCSMAAGLHTVKPQI